MDKKTTRRIIGSLVVVALIIIILPLLLNNSDNQTIQTATANNATPAPFTETAIVAGGDNSLPDTKVMADNAITPPITSNPFNVETSELPPAPANAPAKIPTVTPPIVAPKVDVPLTPANKNIAVTSNSSASVPPVHTIALTPKPPINQVVISKTKPSKVIQMGSFKVQANAKRLTKQLGAKGYNAFMITAKSGKTQVYVVPKSSATTSALINKIKKDVKVQGFITQYNWDHASR